MKTPIFLYGEGYISVFSTVGKTEGYLEAVDVINGNYTAYDSEGYKLAVTVTPDNAVAINPVEPPIKMVAELRELLQTFLSNAKTASVSDNWLASASLGELVAKALEHKTR